MLYKFTGGLHRVFRRMSTDNTQVKEMAASVIKNYLNGHWKMADSSNIIVQKLKGGLSNWLYKISLSSYQNENAEPKTVLLRIYGPNHGRYNIEQIINDSLVFMMMSERRLGPKLHGVFSGGRIEEYISSRPLKTSELSNLKISPAIAAKIAQVHSLSVPISKNPDFLFDLMSNWLAEIQKSGDQYNTNRIENEEQRKTFKTYDLLSEIKWLRHYLKKLNSMVVFSHNDLQEGNILITDESIKSDEPDLVLIDYEYCSYNYRGFDLANHFLEHTINYQVDEHPYFAIDSSAYPSNEQQVKFIRKYLEVYNNLVKVTSSEIKATDFIENEIESDVTLEESRLLVEVSRFRLLSHLLWGIWAAANSKSGIEFGYWDYCIERLRAYFKTKEEILASESEKVKKAN